MTAEFVHSIRADLNGTGELVDITSFVSEVDGLRHSWGRTDWTSPEPAPGSLSFTLDNSDGRFTPGNTAVYSSGLVVGVLVEWVLTDEAVAPVTVIDNFDRVNEGYPLSSSVASDGFSWQTWGGTGTWIVQLGAAVAFAGGAEKVASIPITATDGVVTGTLATIHGTLATRKTGLAFRIVDDLNYYRIRASNAADVWLVESVVAGVVTVLLTSAIPAAAGDVVRAELSGSTLTAFVNGVALGAPIVMASHLSATSAGLYGNAADLTSSWGRFSVVTGNPAANTRTLRFRTLAPELRFGLGVPGGSTVSVTCRDALAVLAGRKMRQMVDEVAFSEQPVAYWPISESDSGATARAMDISGNAETPLIPTGDTALMSWANGIGPRTDGRAALSLQPDATAGVVASADTPGLVLERTLGTSGTEAQWYSEDYINEEVRGFGFSFWFSVRDIYGPTVGGGAATDGPYVFLARVGNVSVWWRVADRKIILSGINNLFPLVMTAQASIPACDVGTVNHVFVNVNDQVGVSLAGTCSTQLWVNGVASTTVMSGPKGTSSVPPAVQIAGDHGGVSIGTGTTTQYGLSGTVACMSVYADVEASALVAAGVIPDFYPVGASGPDELADARFLRIGGWLRRNEIAFASVGTPAESLIGPHDTGNLTMLQAMCAVLRIEESALDTLTIDGIDTVRAFMSSEHRGSAALSVSVDSDGAGVPELSFDPSGVAVRVEAKGFTRSVTWEDSAAPDRWHNTSASVTAATDDVGDLRALAQFRSLLGRVTALAPSRVAVDARSSVADLTAELFDLHPMVRVSVTGMPADVVGYDEVDCILIGAVEQHSQGRVTFTLQLTPDLPYIEGIVEEARCSDIPDPELFVADPVFSGTNPVRYSCVGGFGVGREFPQIDALTNVATSMAISMIGARAPGSGLTGPPADDWLFPTGALPDPVYVRIEDEIVAITAAAARTYTIYSAGSSPVRRAWVSAQVVTIARAQLGTTAAAHPRSGGDIYSAAVSPVVHEFLDLDSCATF
jgi:hypothetical protein